VAFLLPEVTAYHFFQVFDKLYPPKSQIKNQKTKKVKENWVKI
jgi:hypothetical protein